MYCTCGCGKELGMEVYSIFKKDEEFYSEDCMDRYYEDKQIEMELDHNE